MIPDKFLRRMFLPFSLTLRSGPLRGNKWIVSSGISFLKGTYEPEKSEAVVNTIKKGEVILDVGAHIGYFSLLMAKCAGSKGKVYSFEPRGINQLFLKKHIRINKFKNIEVIEKAISDGMGNESFSTKHGTGTGRLSDSGDLRVETTSIDIFCKEREISPTFIKIDIEGGEVKALNGAKVTLNKLKPTVLLATHGDELDEYCDKFLCDLGYKSLDLNQLKGDKEVLYTYQA